ncbi:PREDICTED: pentatricopeptide repeat-containing protein At5g66520-like [Nelumbo nucifera]|uniref:Pentatricopeptide repeat-containing protein At5g66520-like n=2 Tax=Nelumbo nucifera TaxID=4432 RepID=A0A1U7ZM84_NELNU|nr:PREDICTED: pentatricopeptide repeat-containing protein At5g66520-like [Nelumbo nucifera]DAD40765.1 TPA_asm: hypothetical protein HUJ06_015088 [Nelumbo nucifera]
MASGYLARKMALLHHPKLSQALDAFTNMSEFKQTHAHIITSGLFKDIFTTARLLAFAAISESGSLSYAEILFDQIKHPTLFMYNSMIRGFSQSTKPLESLKYYVRMLRVGISPDNFTFPFLIRSCSISSLLFQGQLLHAHAIKCGLVFDVFILNNMINMYAACGELNSARLLFEECFSIVDVVSWTTLVTGYSNSGDIDVAREFFDQMPYRNLVSWNAVIAGYAHCGKIEEARKMFDEMPERNVASWSTMISGYAQSGFCKEALELFGEMVGARIIPNEPALVSTVSACAQHKELEKGLLVHNYIKEQKFDINVTLGTALVDMYGKCGSIEKALEVFSEMPIKNVLSWNSMIAGLSMNGCGKQAMSLFWRMQMIGPTPNAITFIGVLSGCSHSGLVDEGRYIFNLMTQKYHIKPQLEHYGCIVDLLGRAGLIKEALDFIDGMPVQPHAGLWGALVGACSIHGDVKLGEEVGKHLIELEPHHSGRYVLLSNIFAAAKRWDDAAMVRNLLKERRVFKTAGSSMVETWS